jgi:hypothetical protein
MGMGLGSGGGEGSVASQRATVDSLRHSARNFIRAEAAEESDREAAVEREFDR